jgi:phosphoesterase RecJ-like protein
MDPKGADAIAELLRAGGEVLVVTHVHPEGDALGCQLALGCVAERWGCKVTMALSGGWPEQYGFLPGIDRIVVADHIEGRFAATVVADCAALDRAGGLVTVPDPRFGTVVNIDHHEGNPGYGEINVVDPEAAAAGEVVYGLLERWGVPLDADLALWLYTALSADTGSFSFPNTRPATLRAAAHLRELGVDVATVTYQLFGRTSLPRLHLTGRMLSRATQEGPIAWGAIFHDDFVQTGTTALDTENLVNMINDVHGTRVGILFREDAPGKFKISLRSRAGVNVAEIARVFSGGGHREAAGCSIKGTFDEVRVTMLAAVARHLRNAQTDLKGETGS